MNGVLIIDKPAGMTSHDVVSRIRRIFHQKRVGHTGTLDPDATGVLPICLGQATRLAEYLTADDKVYAAKLAFGKATDTQDASGVVIEELPLPNISEEAFKAILASFLGPQLQIPPKYSAIKVNGVPLYRLAREGKVTPDVKPRQITVHSISLTEYTPDSATFEACVSKGTYIRSLCADIGRAAGSCAHMTQLRRLASGRFTISEAVALEVLETADQPEGYILPMLDALSDYPQLMLSEESYAKIKHGSPIEINDEASITETPIVAVYQDAVCAIGFATAGYFKPKKVFIQ